MSAEKNRGEVVRYWRSKAEESLSSAKRELDAGALTFAMNRTYYATFYAVSAALLEGHARFKKHAGVRAAFHREFIRSKLLDVRWGKFYDQLFQDRQEGDYLALIEFDRIYVEDQMARCHQFLAHLRPMVSSLREKRL
ncbi:MAG: HEPN domain-containing protein [Bacteroidota bacterium]